MSEYQNIVIVGASVAGQALANALVPKLKQTHRILLIDALDHAFWPIAALRAAVVPGWEKRVTVTLSTPRVFPKNTPHQVIAPNKVVELKRNSIVLEKEFEGSVEVPFFKCVLATGSIQPSPMRPHPGMSEAETHAMLVKEQKDLAKATSVVIIGGGAVGIEMSGEIRERFPSTKITLVHSLPNLLNPTQGEEPTAEPHSYSVPRSSIYLSRELERQCKELNINCILSNKVNIPSGSVSAGEWDGSQGLQDSLKKVKLANGKTLEADYIFISIGNKAGSGLVEKADPGALTDGMGNMIDVDEYLRVRSTSSDSILTKDYYAIGDVSATPGWKTSQGAADDGAACAVNILADVNKRSLKIYGRKSLHFLVVPLGPNNGAGAGVFPIFGERMLPNVMVRALKRDLFVEANFYSRFTGAEPIAKVAAPA